MSPQPQKDQHQDLTITLLPDPSTIHASALSTWRKLFSTIGPTNPHPSPTAFAAIYTPPNGRFLLASAPDHPIAGTVSYRAYDFRFASLPGLEFEEACTSGHGKVVEVARLHVEPELRGRGIATALVRELIRVAKEDGVQVMYLHTHPFLPGAVALWEKMGWRVVLREEEGPWFTIHMRRDFLVGS